MGVSFRASAVIGVRIPVDRLYRSVLVQMCKHEVPSGAKFCPECGKQANHLAREPIDGFKPDSYPGLPKLFGFDCVSDTGETCWFVGLAVQADADGKPQRAALSGSLGLVYQRLRESLQPVGLWDETMFGMWAVPHVSC